MLLLLSAATLAGPLQILKSLTIDGYDFEDFAKLTALLRNLTALTYLRLAQSSSEGEVLEDLELSDGDAQSLCGALSRLRSLVSCDCLLDLSSSQLISMCSTLRGLSVLPAVILRTHSDVHLTVNNGCLHGDMGETLTAECTRLTAGIDIVSLWLGTRADHEVWEAA